MNITSLCRWNAPQNVRMPGRFISLIAAFAVSLLLAMPAMAVDTVPILWEGGGGSSGLDSAGNAARMAVDTEGNVAVVSGPASGRGLAVTSYTSAGVLRWKSSITPASGTFLGDWVVAAPNGDFVAVGHSVNSSGKSIQATLVRFAADGTFQWRVDLAGVLPSIGRLLVDSGGNAYLAFNSAGDGQDIRLHKYDPLGNLLWSKFINTSSLSNNYATSLALSPDEYDVVLTGGTLGGVEWIVASYDTNTGTEKWKLISTDGAVTSDVLVDDNQVYVTGLGGNGTTITYLTVVAYDRATGTKLWRKTKLPADSTGNGMGLRMAKAPDGSLVVTGRASRGYLDWYTVAFNTDGSVKWEAVRDGGLNQDEYPVAVLVLADGTTVVSGRGGPNLPGGYIPGKTVGYSPDGVLLWEATSLYETKWAAALPSGDVCATGGSNAYIACFRPSSGTPINQPPVAVVTATPLSGTEPLVVSFDAGGSSDPDGTIASYTWNFGDGGTATGSTVQHIYYATGTTVTYVATLTVTDNLGGTSTSSVSIVVNSSNQPPVAAFTATPITGSVPLTVNFDASSSSDPDGTISTYLWYVGDGMSRTGAQTQYTYKFAGNYVVTLQVTDNLGATSTASVTIVVTDGGPTGSMHIADLDGVGTTKSRNNWNASVTATVLDVNNFPVSGATVNGTWGKSSTASCTTSTSGTCSVSKGSKALSETFTVTGVTHSTLTYDATANTDPDGDSNGTVITIIKP